MNIGVAQIRGALLYFLWGKIALLYLCRMQPSISKKTQNILNFTAAATLKKT